MKVLELYLLEEDTGTAVFEGVFTSNKEIAEYLGVKPSIVKDIKDGNLEEVPEEHQNWVIQEQEEYAH